MSEGLEGGLRQRGMWGNALVGMQHNEISPGARRQRQD